MTTALLTVVLVIVGIGGLFFNLVSLWFVCRWLRLPQQSWRRCSMTVAAMLCVNVACSAGLLAVTAFNSSAGILRNADWAWPLGNLVLMWLVVKRVHGGTPARSAAALAMVTGMSIAVSLPMAIAFRTFLAEAFVVPTGAMAVTILGAHADVSCANCGYTFPITMSERVGRPFYSRYGESRIKRAVCPLCGDTQELDETAAIQNGDRILADKISQITRWDNIVFRFPKDPRFNYVKRVVGMPFEEIAIEDGDLFANGRRLRKHPVAVADDLWILVHDTNFRPQRDSGIGWRAETATEQLWAEGGWTFNATDGTATLAFKGQIRDDLSYNVFDDWRVSGSDDVDSIPPPSQYVPVSFPVGDVRVDVWPVGFKGSGRLTFRWAFTGTTITAKVDAAGNAQLDISSQTDASLARTVTGTLPMPRLKEIPWSFVVRDGWACMVAGGELVVEARVSADDAGGMAQPSDLPEPVQLSLSVSDCSGTISRIVVLRDVYYRTPAEMDFPPMRSSEASRWTYQLKSDEYLTLGDNSSQSKDSRFWGSVPKDNIIGVVECIYWPPGRMRAFRN